MPTPKPSPACGPTPTPELLADLVGVLDLTTLQSTDTPERVGALCARARDPLGDGSATVAAVCVYPTLVPAAAEALAGSPVRVASVAGAFPSGMSPLHLRVAEAAWCVQQGAQEIDMVISRGEFLAGRFDAVVEEVAQVRQAIGQATLKVILEVGQLGSPQAITRASELVVAQLRDGDFIKTSTGKEGPGASLEATACMLAVLANAWRNGGPKVGLKPAGGVRTTEQAVAYWRQACEAMSAFEPWRRPDPRVFRLGASSLLDDLARAIADRSAG